MNQTTTDHVPFPAETQAQFAREADMLRKVGAPDAPAVYESGLLADQRAFIAMERLDGISLAGYLEGLAAPVAPVRAIALFDAILAAVQAARSKPSCSRFRRRPWPRASVSSNSALSMAPFPRPHSLRQKLQEGAQPECCGTST